MTTANQLLMEGKTDEAEQIFHLFREVFYGEKALEDWLDYAKFRLHGDAVEMQPRSPPAPPAPPAPPEAAAKE